MRINTHVHTPYSFSAFDSIGEIVATAKHEGVAVLGINDFNTVEGHGHFAEECSKNMIYPLFNIEFATVIESDKTAGFYWNDPLYAGVMHLCGKALDFPVAFNSDSRNLIGAVWKISQDRIWKIITKLNDYFKIVNIDYQLDYNVLRSHYAKHAITDWHITRAVYTDFMSRWGGTGQLEQNFKTILKTDMIPCDSNDTVQMLRVIRSKLLDTGSPGFVEEYYNNSLRFYEAKMLILSAGGIPCYTLLLDSSQPLTDKERNIDLLINELLSMDIRAVEFIPEKITIDLLKKYARRFYEKGFIVTFGTEHNQLERQSLVPRTWNGKTLDDELLRIGYDGACIYAAHQEMHHQKCPGFVDDMGKRIIHPARIRDFIRIGDDVIKRALSHEFQQELKWYEPNYS
jgi:PHP domain